MTQKCLVVLHWQGGHSHKIGEMNFEYTPKEGYELKPRSSITRRFGWAMVKHGIRMMVKGAKDDDKVY